MLINDFFMICKKMFEGNEIIYISSPINTGKRFIDWYELVGKNLIIDSDEYCKEKEKNVVKPNINAIKEYVKKIRKKTSKVIIEPTNIENDMLNWSQNEFYQFWDRVIKELVDEVIFLDGWEYSIGCCYEYLSAIVNNKKTYNQNMKILDLSEAINKIKESKDLYDYYKLQDSANIGNILGKLLMYQDSKNNKHMKQIEKKITMKDEKLHYLVTNDIANVAQFISFDPYSNLIPKYVHINNYTYEKIHTTKEVIERLILSAPSKSVNIRTFSPGVMKGNRLIFNKKVEDIDDIIRIVIDNSNTGKHTIINENISINDAGVSGVVLGDVIEFSPEDTPKCVDKEDVCSLPRSIGLKVLSTVYGFSPDINFDSNYRVEFSIHPSRQGVKKEHTIIWEYEYYEEAKSDKKILWPNRFSRFIGDKVFGLLIADAYGLLVPKTTVISRKIAPFSFGIETGLKEKWIRTCPIEKEPGKYYTGSVWTDPFELMKIEEAKGFKPINIASIICQDAIEAKFSGASFIRHNSKDDVIEGVSGTGDLFMIGERNKEELPKNVIEAVKELNDQLRNYHNELGDVSIEWVYDGTNVWVVQLNKLKNSNNQKSNNRRVIVDGNPKYYEKVFVSDGLDSLREKINLYKNINIGIELIGNVGITSHFGDLLRLNNIPSFLTMEE